MKVLALDPSAGITGWAFFTSEQISIAGWVEFKKTEFNGDRYLEASRWLQDMITEYNPDLILIESYFFSKRFATGTSVNSEIRGCLKMTSREANIPYEVINPTRWKKDLMGRVYPTKKEKKQYGKLKAKKIIVYNNLIQRGFIFPEKVTNPRTNKSINFKYDISDALGILISFLEGREIQYTINSNILGAE